jgi:hypothetical protein
VVPGIQYRIQVRAVVSGSLMMAIYAVRIHRHSSRW